LRFDRVPLLHASLEEASKGSAWLDEQSIYDGIRIRICSVSSVSIRSQSERWA